MPATSSTLALARPLKSLLKSVPIRLRAALLSSPDLRLLFLVALVYRLFRWRRGLRVPAPKLGGRKVVFLGPGGGHAAYSVGFIDGLLDDAEIRAAMLERGAVFGGVSSGAHAAAAAMAALGGVLTLREWYTRMLRSGYETVGTHGTRIMGRELTQAGRSYFDTCSAELGGVSPPWLQHFPVSVTELPSLRPRFFTSFSDAEQFGRAIRATSYVPGLMGNEPWDVVDGRRVFDGYAGALRIKFPDNYMYMSFLPTVPHAILRNKHFLDVSPFDTTEESLPVKSFPWGDTLWADKAFDRGRANAIDNQPELRRRLLEFLHA